jgi:hypothetical protein
MCFRSTLYPEPDEGLASQELSQIASLYVGLECRALLSSA